jgi:hypothetical protein
MPRKRRTPSSLTSTPVLIHLEVEGDQIWDARETATVQQAALDVGNAIARDIQSVTEQSRRITGLLSESGAEVEPAAPLEPVDAFLKVYGRPVRFLRKEVPSGGTWWGETKSRDLVLVFRNAPHSFAGDAPSSVGNRPEFSVHELGHVFENVILAAIGVRKGRNSIPSSQVNRPNGFYQPLLQPKRFQQSQDLGRGEIFADMFLGWVYDRWETIDGKPDSPLREAGIARKQFMERIMIELIETAISHNQTP